MCLLIDLSPLVVRLVARLVAEADQIINLAMTLHLDILAARPIPCCII